MTVLALVPILILRQALQAKGRRPLFGRHAVRYRYRLGFFRRLSQCGFYHRLISRRFRLRGLRFLCSWRLFQLCRRLRLGLSGIRGSLAGFHNLGISGQNVDDSLPRDPKFSSDISMGLACVMQVDHSSVALLLGFVT